MTGMVISLSMAHKKQPTAPNSQPTPHFKTDNMSLHMRACLVPGRKLE